MHVLRFGTALIGGLALCAGCGSTNVSVAAKPAVDTYSASVGNLNTPNFALGDVVVLDPETRQATKVASVQVEPADVQIGTPAPGVTEPVSFPLDLTYSQNVQPSLRSEVESMVSAKTALHVENCFERKLAEPGAFAVRDASLSSILTKFREEQPEAKFFLVSSVVSADKVFLTYSGNSDEIKVGKYTFRVSYPRNARLEQLAKDQPAFFKLTPITLEDRDGQPTVVVDENFHENLTDYTVKATVAQTE